MEKHVIPKPRPQQRKALAAIRKAFRSSDRATIVMACGTGKTFVGLWAAQQQRAKTVLVLVPSLGLIQQTLAEWKVAAKVQFKWLCCCSDRGVEDALVDAQFEPTNDRDAIHAFMRSGGTRVIFSTYQSADSLRRLKFDLIIVDEAHKTVGEKRKPFAFALHDRNISAKKRLFMTATPRVLEEKPNRTKSPHSMDITKTYGDTVYRLPFSQAVNEKIIVDYKILVCEVRPEEISDDVDLDKVDLEHAVGLIAVKKAMKKYKIQKVITFNSSIDAAQRFADAANGYVRASVHHINGNMSISERTSALKSFKAHDRALITNARCLTEGIDVPTVDMVTFLAPKRSVVDVTQAAGRVMRRSPGKRCGYILLPVLVDSKRDEDALDEAMRRGRFDRTFEILLTLQDNDDVLAATMNRACQELGESNTDELSNETRAAIAERVEYIGDSKISARMFDVALAKRLGRSWYMYFGRVKAYVNAHGIRNAQSKNHFRHYKWLSGTLADWRDGKLSSDKVTLLSHLGFSIPKKRSKKVDRCTNCSAVSRKYRYGRCLTCAAFFKRNGVERPRNLYALIRHSEEAFAKRLSELKDFVRANGRFPNSSLTSGGFRRSTKDKDRTERKLAGLVQRLKSSKFKLSKEKQRILSENADWIGDALRNRSRAIGCDAWTTVWEDCFNQVISALADETCPLSRTMAQWMSKQRRFAREGKLPTKMVKRLKSIDASFRRRRERERYEKWATYMRETYPLFEEPKDKPK